VTTPTKDLAILVGNGLSVAFNRELMLKELTREVLDRIQKLTGDTLVNAMKAVADLALPEGATSEDDFEVFVGAFGDESRRLDLLARLAQAAPSSDTELQDSVKRVTEFTSNLRDTAISHVLEVIFERSRMNHVLASQFSQTIQSIVSTFEGDVTFGNLNYDTILLATLMGICPDEVADMAHGWETRVALDLDGHHKVMAPPLRQSVDEFPDEYRVWLLHLHGSLTYWRSPNGRVGKVSTQYLEDVSPWDGIRTGANPHRPVVILANQGEKSELARQNPFALAYSMFASAIHETPNWLIIGYSFKDSEVNKTLRDEFLSRDPKPTVLVVTHGNEPTRDMVEVALGWGAEDGSSTPWLLINRLGAIGLEGTDSWQDFVLSSR
jgi:SIR2-like domain